MKRPWIALIALALPLGACGYVNEYEKAVYDYEPSYCYQSLGGVTCYDKPFHRDEKRLVNYYGPHPTRYDPPERDDYELPPGTPPASSYYKDPEPDVSQLMEVRKPVQSVHN